MTTFSSPDVMRFLGRNIPPSGNIPHAFTGQAVSDLKHRAEVCQNANQRYLEALACAHDSTPLKNWTDKLCRTVTWKNKRLRAFNPFTPHDVQLLRTVMRGEFAINGFTNKDIRVLAHDHKLKGYDDRKISASTTRQLRLLRAHGLIRKVPKCHRYHLTHKGRLAITALLTARETDAVSLTKLGA